jgi:hypothetical protein
MHWWIFGSHHQNLRERAFSHYTRPPKYDKFVYGIIKCDISHHNINNTIPYNDPRQGAREPYKVEGVSAGYVTALNWNQVINRYAGTK